MLKQNMQTLGVLARQIGMHSADRQYANCGYNTKTQYENTTTGGKLGYTARIGLVAASSKLTHLQMIGLELCCGIPWLDAISKLWR